MKAEEIRDALAEMREELRTLHRCGLGIIAHSGCLSFKTMLTAYAALLGTLMLLEGKHVAADWNVIDKDLIAVKVTV